MATEDNEHEVEGEDGFDEDALDVRQAVHSRVEGVERTGRWRELRGRGQTW